MKFETIFIICSQITIEGWCKSWDDDSCSAIPRPDRGWLRDDVERGMFAPIQVYKDTNGEYKKRRTLKTDRMWFYPPECPGVVHGSPPSPDCFFRSRLCFWRPVGVWKYSIRCPRINCPARDQENTFLYRSGYHSRARQICDVAGWYTLVTEVLSCGPCNKAASKGGSKSSKWGRFLAWDTAILSQLTEAHQAMFPATLTAQ